jgi:hypothetical protein
MDEQITEFKVDQLITLWVKVVRIIIIGYIEKNK